MTTVENIMTLSKEEILDWVSKFKDDCYTKVPEEYTGENYEKWFSIDRIKEKFNGDVERAAEAHPVYHLYFLKGFKPRDYQVFALDEMVKYKYVMSIWGRRLGKSLTYKAFISWAIHWNKYPQGRDKSTKVIVMAHTADSAESYIEEIKDMFETGDKRVSKLFKGALGEHYFTSRLPTKSSGKKNNNTNMKYLSKDGRWCSVEVYPPTPRARGRPASIIIMDEVAFWEDYTPDEYKIYREVVRPVITFQDMMTLEDEYKDQNALDSFLQEYCARLIANKGSYFEDVEKERVFSDLMTKRGHVTLNFNPRFLIEAHAAIDFGGSQKSHTVFTVAYLVRGLNWKGEEDNISVRVFHHRYPVAKDSTLQSDILKWDKQFNISKWHIDSQGGGSSFYDWFNLNFKGKIDEVSFRGEKVDMYRQFKIACFQGRVKSYRDNDMLSEMNGFTSDLKPSKSTTDDMLDSFVMCIKDWLQPKKKSAVTVLNINKGKTNERYKPFVR